MSVPYYSPMSFWLMPNEEFNEWRAQNDLPLLREFFIARLPRFKDWLDEFGIDAELFCRIVPTGALFTGSGRKLLAREEIACEKHSFFRLRKMTRGQFEQRCRELGQAVPPVLEFEPYFDWAKKRLGRERYFRLDASNDSRIDNFIFNRWTQHKIPEKSRASLLGDFETLKLGGVTLNERIYLGGRNLDFADLDHLVVKDRWHGPGAVEINYSSCRHMVFAETLLHHFEFRQCDMDRLTCQKSDLHNFKFVECTGKQPEFSDSRLSKVSFLKGTLFPDFTACEMEDITYKPRRGRSPAAVSDEYRRLRSAAQGAGKRFEASKYYYLERKFERRSLASPYAENPALFPVGGNSGRLPDVAARWWKGEISGAQALKDAGEIFLFRLRVWTSPKLMPRALGFKLRCLGALLEEIVWGYGERPLRIFATALCLIAFYAAVYYFYASELSMDPSQATRLVNSIYLSVITFTTVGYGDITPKTEHMKLICATEALFGCFTMGLVVAGFSNKSRY
ncbi:MAG: hypothetical protein EPN97_09215 [Alphaproteobacteria bacterium]|nr:MAG: hypothetical protein EPN97_09215 [Alphaproteobacteria bacterium]